MRSLSKYSYPTLFVLAFGLVVGTALLITASTSTVAFGAFNTAWDGTADLRSLADTTGTESHFVHNTSTYTDQPAAETIAFILAPEKPYQRQETTQIRRFVQHGGTLIVADERAAPTNALLAAIGADARIDGDPLRDGRYHYRSPAAPQVRNLSTHSLLSNVSMLTLNHGSAVTPHTATPLANTSGYAYRDNNHNQELDTAETVSQYSVITIEQVEQGQVIVVGDASVFINTMLKRSDNRQFARNLIASHERVLFDYSHTVTLPPVMQLVLFLRRTPAVQFLCGGLGVLAIALLHARPPLLATAVQRLRRRRSAAVSESDTESATGESSPVTDTTLVAHLRTRYPDWDDDRLQRIVAARRQQPDQADAVTPAVEDD